jgi:uncharacterized protein YsxB (DUF464 family)
MMRVRFAENGKKLSLSVEGHAEYAEHGKDIVCAAASILAYTLASSVRYVDASAVIDMSSGKTYIESGCEEAEGAFRFAKTGFSLLAHNYPQYVRLEP